MSMRDWRGVYAAINASPPGFGELGARKISEQGRAGCQPAGRTKEESKDGQAQINQRGTAEGSRRRARKSANSAPAQART